MFKTRRFARYAPDWLDRRYGLYADADIEANPGTGGVKFRVFDDGTRVWPYSIPAFNLAGAIVDVDASNPLPVTISGAATAAAQATGNASLASIDGKITAVNTGAVVLAAGTAEIGKVTNSGTFAVQASIAAAQTLATVTTVGTVSAVTAITNALPSGSNVIGQVTANAGTNLNTSLLALEGGGNLAAAAASLSVIDDWDESDRAKVNLIAAQAGIDGNTGVVSAKTVRVTLATDIALPAGTNNIGDVDVLTVPTDPFGVNADAASATGSISAKLRFIAATGIPITGTVTVGSHAVTNAGTFAVQAACAGDVAHAATNSGNPLQMGMRATSALSGLTLVADAQRTSAMGGLDGVQIVRNHCNLEDVVSGNASNTDGASTQVIAASGANIKTYLTKVTLTNTSATFAYVEMKDGTTIKHTIPVPATAGATIDFDPPIPGTANTAWNFDPSAATTTIICSAVGFKSKV